MSGAKNDVISHPQSDSISLADCGELRLIREVLLPLARIYEPETTIGDDCAFMEIGDIILAVTADVGPKPLIQTLDTFRGDLEAAGWLAAVATVSDVSTAGAAPLFLTNCIDAPPELSVSDFSSFMNGYFRACSHFGFRNAGGDVRQGEEFRARVFGVGLVEHGYKIGRAGAEAGDMLVVVGHPGRFMAHYLLAKSFPSRPLDNESMEILRFPKPPLEEMRLLAQKRLIRAASDASDGLLGAIENIASRSGCNFILTADEKLLPPVVRKAAQWTGYDPWNIFFCWGDWSVAAVVPAKEYEVFAEFATDAGVPWLPLGVTEEGNGCLHARRNTRTVAVRPVRNENFRRAGFNSGVKGHLDYMLETPIWGT
jgi:thiamine-monophosphate kinase